MIPNINLLPRYEKPDRRVSILIGIILIIWLVLLLLVTVFYITSKTEQSVIDSRINTLTIEKNLLEGQLQSQMGTTILTLPDAVQSVESLTVPASYIVAEIQSQLPTSGNLLFYSYNINGLSIETQFLSYDSIALFISNLNESNLFSEVIVNTISADSEGEVPTYYVDFQLEINRSALDTEVGGEGND